MFPNVRLMAASSLVSVLALFFAFGVYASLRVSHAPLARSARAAPLQLVGFNVAMLPVTVLEPFAGKNPTPAAADNSAALAYSLAQTAPPVAVTPDARADNTAADEPVENSDVTQTQITGALESAREPRAPDATPPERAEPTASMAQITAAVAPPPASPSAASPSVTSPTAPVPPQTSPAEKTAAIETIPAAVGEPAAVDDDTAVDTDIAPKKKKKKRHLARRHFYRMPLRAVAQSAAPQQQSLVWPAGIGGPLVAAPKR
jgi:hypothetical protein